MSLKLHVTINKKRGLPEYSSLGAACGLELELDESLLTSDPDGLQARIRQAYATCTQAVDEELDRQRAGTTPGSTAAPAPESRRPVHQTNGHQASEKQISYARQLAGQIDGLGVRNLESLAQKMFSKPLAGLTTLDASGLIDALKDIKAGKIDLAAALDGLIQQV